MRRRGKDGEEKPMRACFRISMWDFSARNRNSRNNNSIYFTVSQRREKNKSFQAAVKRCLRALVFLHVSPAKFQPSFPLLAGGLVTDWLNTLFLHLFVSKRNKRSIKILRMTMMVVLSCQIMLVTLCTENFHFSSVWQQSIAKASAASHIVLCKKGQRQLVRMIYGCLMTRREGSKALTVERAHSADQSGSEKIPLHHSLPTAFIMDFKTFLQGEAHNNKDSNNKTDFSRKNVAPLELWRNWMHCSMHHKATVKY